MEKFCGRCGARLDEATGLCPNCDAPKSMHKDERLSGILKEVRKNPKAGPRQDAPVSRKETREKRKADKKTAKKEWKAQKKAVRKAEKKAKREAKTFGQKLKIILFGFLAWVLALSILVVLVVCLLKVKKENSGYDICEDGYETYIKYENMFLSVETTYLNNDGYVESSDIPEMLDEVEQIAWQGMLDGTIAYYNRDNDNIFVKFSSGIPYLFIPCERGILSGGAGGKILTLEPNEDDYNVNLSYIVAMATAWGCEIEYQDSLRPSSNANLVAEKFPDLYTYDYRFALPYDVVDPLMGTGGSLRNSNVTVNSMKELADYKIIIWEGHGAYNEKIHSALITGESFVGWKEFSKYKKDLEDDIVILTSFPTVPGTDVAYSPMRYYGVTSKFVEKYIGDMRQSLVFLGACSSLKDDVLAQSFLEKGADVVLGYTQNTTMYYEMISRTVFFNELIKEKGSRNQTVANAYQETMNVVGSDNGCILSYVSQDGVDHRYTLNGIISDNSTDDLLSQEPIRTTSDERDIVLVLDTSGSMSGTPMAETKKASVNFIGTILDEDASIGIVTYDDSASMLSDFSVNEAALKTAVSGIYDDGRTNMDAGLSTARSMLQRSNAKKKIIVIMSDGLPNEGRVDDSLIAFADEIKNDGVLIYTLGFFEDLGSDKSTAQHLMEQLASEGCHYEVASADDLVFFFGDIADQINGTRYIYVRIACPVDVSVSYNGETLNSAKSDLSQRTEFGTLTYEKNQNAAANTDDRIKILRLKEGVGYDIQIVGTGRGVMDYTIGFVDEEGEYSDFREFEDIKITKSTVIDTVAEVSDETVLRIDEDGDGRYDISYRAEKNGYGEEIRASWLKFAIMGVFFAAILALELAVFSRKRRKRK